MKQHPMQQFHDLLAKVLTEGKRRPNRTGVDTFFLPGAALTFDLADGFPAITTKKLAFKSAVGELLGFFRGYTNSADFESIGCKVWHQNANETPAWLGSPFRQGQNDLGRVYSSQWTDWWDWREATSADQRDAYLAKGYEIRCADTERQVWVMRRGMNQLEIALRQIMTDPTNRRIMISGWRPDEFDQMALPPCHVSYQFLVDVDTKELNLCVYQRSWDMFLSFNLALDALFLCIMAKLAGLTPRSIQHFVGDCHIYENHVDQVRELLSRDHYAQPTLGMGASIPTLASVDDIAGVFARIQPEDLWLENYQHHPAIKAPMAA